MRWLAVVEWSIDVPSLELSVSCGEGFLAWRISVIVVASSSGCEVLDAIVVITLITFANQTDIWCCRDAVNRSFLLKVSFYVLQSGSESPTASIPPVFANCSTVPWP